MADIKQLLSDTEDKLSLPPGLLTSVAKKESNFDPKAFNDKVGASGIMQIVPKWHPNVDPFNPEEAIPYAGQYLKDLKNQFGSWDKALAAYNWGPGNLKKAIDKHGDGWLAHSPEETQDYVATITGEANPDATEAQALSRQGPVLTATFKTRNGKEIPLKGTREQIEAEAARIQEEIEVHAPERARQEAFLQAEVDSLQNMDTVDKIRKSGAEAVRGLLDVALMLGTGAAAEVGGGIVGAGTLLATGDADTAANVIRTIQDTFTYNPRSKGGRNLIQNVAPALAKIDETVDTVALGASGGDPLVGAAIKTIIYGAPEVLGLKGLRKPVLSEAPITATMRHGRPVVGLDRRFIELDKFAQRLGINLNKPWNMRSDVLEAARRLTPEEFGAAMPVLREQLGRAHAMAKRNVDAAYETARNGRAFLDTSAAKGMAKATVDDLVREGFDLPEMPSVQRSIEELRKLDTHSPIRGDVRTARIERRLSADLNDVEIIRKRINKRIKGAPDSSTRAALYRVKNNLDDLMNDSFNNAAITGDPQAIAAWQKARRQNTDLHRRFNEDRVIKNLLMDREATPEMMARWIEGTSAMAAKPEAARTIRRLKEIIPENSPAWRGMQNDYLLSVMEPLFRDGSPNYQSFINNYDKMIRKNPSVVKELGLNMREMEHLRAFAKVAVNAPVPPPLLTKATGLAAVTRYLFGHGIARAAVRVSFMKGVVGKLFGVDMRSRRSIISELTEADFGKPMLDSRNSVKAAQVAVLNMGAIARDNED